MTMLERSTWRLVALVLALGGSAGLGTGPPGAGLPGGGWLGPVPLQAQDASPAFDWDVRDPRIGLAPGLGDAGEAIRNLEHVANLPRPDGFFNPTRPQSGAGFSNTDLAFRGDFLFQGNYNGFLVYDISDPLDPTLEVQVVCPGGQGDVSVHGDLLFMSAQERRARVDCGTEGVPDSVSMERFQGVRIFDVSDLRAPRQVAAVQTCRGSHTHTLVTDPADSAHVYIYVSGTSRVRSAAELPGCSAGPADEDPETAYFRIEVIQVPLDAPEEARIVNTPRLFADPVTGEIAGLWEGGDHGEGTQRTRITNQCHDITAYPELGLAAGACSGNGILLDISDPANPVRIDETVDPNFAYWHSATFSHDGTKVVFTDEWGGGTAPRCRASDPPTWGADAVFEIRGAGGGTPDSGERIRGGEPARTSDDGPRMVHRGYYKLPVPQTSTENCVAHNGSLIPVPGRDVMVQAWYQGGLSVLDFTDPEHPVEIAFFDRGPLSATRLRTGGYWSAYWYDGFIYGAEITRGLDVFRLEPSEHLSENEIEAAATVRADTFNAQHQRRFEWPAEVSVAAAYLDQLERNGGMRSSLVGRARTTLAVADLSPGSSAILQLGAMAAAIERNAAEVEAGDRLGDAHRQRLLADAMRALADTMR